MREDTHGWIGTETVTSRFGSFAFNEGYPSAEASSNLYDARTLSRATFFDQSWKPDDIEKLSS